MRSKMKKRVRIKLRRQASVYLVVLGTATLLSAFGIMAILQQRIQRRSLANANDAEQARRIADFGIRYGLELMKQNEDWRIKYSNGDWISNRSALGGTLTVNVVDPEDGDLSDSDQDAVVITGTGKVGGAIQKVEITLRPMELPNECLSKALCLNSDIQHTEYATIRSNRPITVDNITVSNSDIYADVEGESISGSSSQYHGSSAIVTSDERVKVPAVSSIVSYYNTNGTVISINDLSTTSINRIRNGGMEVAYNYDDIDSNVEHWMPYPFAPSEDSKVRHAGSKSNRTLKVEDRGSSTSGAAQHLPWLEKDTAYYTEVWIYHADSMGALFWVNWYTEGTSSSGNWVSGYVYVPGYTWAKVSGVMTPSTWTGDLKKSFIKYHAIFLSGYKDFYIDDVVIRKDESGRFIQRKLISPNHNPYSGGTNAEGIYIIDCNDQKVVIEDSRIQGTIVLKRPGTGSRIGPGPVHWAPAVKGYPALITSNYTGNSDDDFTISTLGRSLSESENGVNFNPNGAAYAGLGTDNDTNDTYPSELNGLFIFEGDLSFKNKVVLKGSILGNDDIDYSSGSLRIEYDPASFLNPPPGLRGENVWQQEQNSSNKIVD